MSLAYMIPVAGSITILVILGLIWAIFKADRGDARMQEIAGAIRQGAMAFLRRQYSTIAMLAIVVALVLFFVSKDGHTAIAFVLGAFCSALAGFIGMYASVNANLRTASAATRSLNAALQVSFRGGAVTGLSVTTLSLLGVAGLFYAFGGFSDPQHAPLLLVGFGFGASFVALFAQLGGGIYTKAADVGADLVGKVEAGIPEDDPRNPAVIADLVGDNVGDCAGRGADLFESSAAENIGAMILGISLFPAFGVNGILFPLVAASFGLLASIIGIFLVRVRDDNAHPMSALNKGYFVTVVLSILALYYSTSQMLNCNGSGLYFFGCSLVGVVTSYLFVLVTEYYTDWKFRPVKEIASACQTGAGTTIITGFSVGLESSTAPAIIISGAILLSYYFGTLSGIPEGGIYGTAVATIGMLSTCGYILAMDTFGPITDNAGGIAEMSEQPENVRNRTDVLDGCGNTTKAITKGYAIGSAALATFLLFSAYIDEVKFLDRNFTGVVNIGKPWVFVGGFLGAMLVFLFASTAIKAVGKTAQVVITEVRRQFREIKGIMEGTGKPDYAVCVDIVTKGALKAMVLPGLIAVAVPIINGYFLKAEAAAAFLMVATMTGILMALLLNNGGGAWDNAKKFIELGQYGGKGSEAHKAAVVGDTVGDPFKDTAGPSLHVLIKLLCTLTLVLAPLFI